jgi:hypothetical protein
MSSDTLNSSLVYSVAGNIPDQGNEGDHILGRQRPYLWFVNDPPTADSFFAKTAEAKCYLNGFVYNGTVFDGWKHKGWNRESAPAPYSVFWGTRFKICN